MKEKDIRHVFVAYRTKRNKRGGAEAIQEPDHASRQKVWWYHLIEPEAKRVSGREQKRHQPAPRAVDQDLFYAQFTVNNRKHGEAVTRVHYFIF